MALIQSLKRHSLLTYFVLAFGLTWACWIPLALSNASASEDLAHPFPFLFLWPLSNIRCHPEYCVKMERKQANSDMRQIRPVHVI
jgi:hypothetical protein